MRPPKKHLGNKRPEAKLQAQIKGFLAIKGWFCKDTHGNMFQSGFPDLYITHKRYGGKWVEVKLPVPKNSPYTGAQLQEFPKLCAFGSPVWVMCAATEAEYQKLFGPSNWIFYTEAWK